MQKAVPGDHVVGPVVPVLVELDGLAHGLVLFLQLKKRSAGALWCACKKVFSHANHAKRVAGRVTDDRSQKKEFRKIKQLQRYFLRAET